MSYTGIIRERGKERCSNACTEVCICGVMSSSSSLTVTVRTRGGIEGLVITEVLGLRCGFAES
jgi:hypothetical protein